MTPVRQQRLRHVLRQHMDGLTTTEAAALAGFNEADTRRSLAAMPDTYVDRWVKGKRGQYMKVWCIAYVPPNSPHPKDRPYKYVPPRTVWQPVGAHA
jgi:hypothetical protein